MNLVDRLLAHPATDTAIVTADEVVTYGELGDRAARWRGRLEQLGVATGDRVAVILGNEVGFVVAHLAAVGLGAALVPLNPASPPAELARELDAVHPKVVLVAAELLGRPGVAPAIRPYGPVVPADLDGAPPTPVQPVEPTTPAVLLFTSGTAGMPKPAILTHANIDASLRSVDALSVDLRAPRQVILAVIPLFHVFGYNALVNLGLDVGATIVLADYAGPEHVASLVAEHRVTLLGGPPTMWQSLAAADVSADHFASVAIALAGAAKLAPATRLAVRERLGLDVDEGYGLTETCAMAASSVEVDAPIGSVGVPLPGVEARIVDGAGNDVLVGDPGELLLRGPMVSPGYFMLPDPAPTDPAPTDPPTTEPAPTDQPTADPLPVDDDGWLHTGDLAVVDDDGHLAIVDRLKDLVIVSGFNVYPGEVEAVLLDHGDIVATGVVGEPDPTTGEALVAYVVPAEGRRLDLDEIDAHCRSQLARYKVPSRYEVRERLPIGPNGKLRRHQLR